MSTTIQRIPSRSMLAPVAGLTLALSAPFLAAASWGDATEGNPLRRFLVTLVVAVVTAVPVFGWAVPRSVREPGGATAVVLGLLALLSILAYWSGICAVVAAGAIVAGLAGWSGPHAKRAWLAVGAGAIALVAFVVLCLIG